MCPCVSRHSPQPAYLQTHHVLPRAWGGRTEPDNMIEICGTTHDATHDFLNALVRAGKGGKVNRQKYPAFAKHLAARAMVAWTALHGNTWPRILTDSRPSQPS